MAKYHFNCSLNYKNIKLTYFESKPGWVVAYINYTNLGTNLVFYLNYSNVKLK